MERVELCPSCGKKKRYNNELKGVFYCFYCGDGGRLEDRAAGHVLDRFSQPPPRPTEDAPENIQPLSKFSVDYLIETRGIAAHLLARIPAYTVDTGIYFPFPGERYWQVRNWSSNAPPRWRMPAGLDGARSGVAYHVPMPGRARTVVLVEGVLDALKVASGGFAAAAMLSKRVHEAQLARLSERYDNAVLMLDADVSTGTCIHTQVLAAEYFPGSVRIASCGGWADPADVPVSRMQEVIRGR